MNRKIIYTIIERSDGSRLSSGYDLAMMLVVVLSLIPLAFKNESTLLQIINWISTGVFILDYCLRWSTADLKLKKGSKSFVLYPITPLAVFDLLAILPSFGALAQGFRLFKLFRLSRVLRIFRALKLVRYSRNIEIIVGVIKKQSSPLAAVGSLAAAYIVLSALVIFNVEPETFGTFFDALYWATISLTTVGYGDIYPVSNAGRVITMCSSLVGIAVVALPAAIITAGYMDELRREKK